MNGAFAVYGTTMVGIPAPAIVGRSVGPALTVLEAPLELDPVLVVLAAEVAEEESVVEASVDVADDPLELEVDSLVEEAVVLVGSSLVLPSRSGRLLSCAITTGVPARASSASICVFLARRTILL
jgi:hypothetical protein